jgi:hypothetical protein
MLERALKQREAELTEGSADDEEYGPYDILTGRQLVCFVSFVLMLFPFALFLMVY